MAPARVSFAPPPLTDSGQSSPASPALTLESAQSDETTADMSELIAIPDDTAHLIIARERLTVVGKIATNYTFDILSATLDEDSQPPRNVTVRKIHQSICSPVPAEMPVTIARFIEVWKDLKHPNVLRLLGYTIFCGEVNQLVSPSLINGDIRDFLNKAPVGVAQRLGFVRDVAAGLDYLHSQRPPICHSNLDPRGILIDENFNAVLTDFKVDDVYLGPWAESRYMSPEKTLEESEIVASDVWAWGCVAFEILTDRRPFDESEGDVQIVNSVIQRKAPGQPDMLLSLVPNAPKPEYASALRLLYSYLPLCWEYEPKKRPLISLLRHQVFIFSFEEDAGDSVVATLEELAHLLIPPERLRIVERKHEHLVAEERDWRPLLWLILPAEREVGVQ